MAAKTTRRLLKLAPHSRDQLLKRTLPGSHWRVCQHRHYVKIDISQIVSAVRVSEASGCMPEIIRRTSQHRVPKARRWGPINGSRERGETGCRCHTPGSRLAATQEEPGRSRPSDVRYETRIGRGVVARTRAASDGPGGLDRVPAASRATCGALVVAGRCDRMAEAHPRCLRVYYC